MRSQSTLAAKYIKLPPECVIPEGWHLLEIGAEVLVTDQAWDFVGQVFDPTTRGGIGFKVPEYLIYIRRNDE